MSEDKNKKTAPEHFVKIIYETSSGKNGETKLPFGGFYNYKISYNENMDDLASKIYDDGGFWVNSDTIIPYNRIWRFEAVRQSANRAKPKSKNNRRRKSKGGNKKTVPDMPTPPAPPPPRKIKTDGSPPSREDK